MGFLAGLALFGFRRLVGLGLRRRPRRPGFVLAGRDLVGRGLGHQLDRFGDPVVILDGAVELERLVELGDLVVGEIGDLLELDQAELFSLSRAPADARYQLEIIGLALGPGEALEGLGLLARALAAR